MDKIKLMLIEKEAMLESNKILDDIIKDIPDDMTFNKEEAKLLMEAVAKGFIKAMVIGLPKILNEIKSKAEEGEKDASKHA